MGDDARLEVRVLGPLQVTAPDGRDVTPTGPLGRRLLALLVLRRGRVTPVDLAAEALWPDTSHEHGGALQSQVSRLRRGLPDGVIDSVDGGYRLRPEAVRLDADELAALLIGTKPDAAATAELDRLLAAWHGPAYPELADTDLGREEAARLGELGVRAAEFRATARLADGRLDGLSADLWRLAAEHPYRERPRALLMRVLVAEGRRAEALLVYDEFRRLLADELGVDPSAELAAAHVALLADPVVPAWTPPTRVPVPPTRLIGRDELLADVLFRCGTGRLVTLVGPGGVGKTRLALEVAGRLRDAAPDRSVIFCELAGADAVTAVDTVAAALGIDARPGEPMGKRLVTMLAEPPVTLVLDNCEHVLEPIAELVVTLLAGCPRLTLVVTTRERLRVPGEQVVPTAPLEVAGTEGPAWELFIERARAASPGFDPGSGRKSPRSSAGSTGCRWRSSSPRRGCTPMTSPRSRRAWTGGSGSSPAASGRQAGTPRWGPRSRGPTDCWNPACRPASRACRCSPGRSASATPPRSHPATRTPSRRRSPASWSGPCCSAPAVVT